MMWKEFEQIAGYEVSYEDYVNYIEPMYMGLPDGVTKADFVAMIDRKRFALPDPGAIFRKIRKEARHLYDICGRYTDFQSEHRLDDLSKLYAKRKYGLDWAKDPKVFVYFIPEYEFSEIQRGCTYPEVMVIGREGREYERRKLIDY